MTGSLISVFMLEVRQIIAGKKLLVVALLLAAAAALAFIVRRFAPDSEPGWPVIYMFMMTFLYLLQYTQNPSIRSPFLHK